MQSRTLTTALLASALLCLVAPAGARNWNVTAVATDGGPYGGTTYSFSPASLSIDAGDTVTFSNPQAGHHNVTADDGSFRCAQGCDGDGHGGSGALSATTWSFVLTFNNGGTFGYHCEMHGSIYSGMHGSITVAAAPPPPELHHGTLQFSSTAYSVTEGTAKASISVTRTGGDDGAVGVSFASAGLTATAGSDFTAVSGTLSWADHESADKVIQVPIVNDTIVEPSETVSLTLSSPTGDAALGTASATLTIHDNDSGGGTTPPTAPAKLVATATSGDSISLSWQDTSSNESEFRVQRRRLSESAFGNDETNAADDTGLVVSGLDPGTPYVFRVRAENSAGNSGYTDELLATTDTTPTPCTPGANQLCVGAGGRFRVDVSWRTHSGSGGGGAVPLPANPDSGLFYFFSASNIEALIKVLNGCGFSSPRYWVFFAATTNVEFTLQVTDTSTGKIKTYFNPIDHAALPVQDTEAFATCP